MLTCTQLLVRMETSPFPSGQLSAAQKPAPYLVQMKAGLNQQGSPGLCFLQKFQYHLLLLAVFSVKASSVTATSCIVGRRGFLLQTHGGGSLNAQCDHLNLSASQVPFICDP